MIAPLPLPLPSTLSPLTRIGATAQRFLERCRSESMIELIWRSARGTSHHRALRLPEAEGGFVDFGGVSHAHTHAPSLLSIARVLHSLPSPHARMCLSVPLASARAGTPQNENGFGGDTTPGHANPCWLTKYPKLSFLRKQAAPLPPPKASRPRPCSLRRRIPLRDTYACMYRTESAWSVPLCGQRSNMPLSTPG